MKLSLLVILGTFVAFIISKRDYFWYAFFFILAEGPGYLFIDSRMDSSTRLPLFTVLPGISLTVSDIFLTLALIKALVRYNNKPIKLKILPYLSLLFIVLVIAYFNGILHQDTEIALLFKEALPFYYYTAYFSFTILIGDFKNLIKFMKILIPISIFVPYTQVYYAINGQWLINEIVEIQGYTGMAREMTNEFGSVRPYIGGVFLFFFNFITALYLILFSKKLRNKIFYIGIVIMSIISFVLSASRGWAIVCGIMLLLFLYRIKSKLLMWSILILLVGSLGVESFISKMEINEDTAHFFRVISDNYSRILEVEHLYSGNYLEINTLEARYWEFQDVKDALFRRPFLGHGIGAYDFRTFEDDLGFPNTILRFGLLGLAVVCYLWWFCYKSLKIAMRKAKNIDLKNLAFVMASAWLVNGIHYIMKADIFTPRIWYWIFFTAIVLAVTEISLQEITRENRTMNLKTGDSDE